MQTTRLRLLRRVRSYITFPFPILIFFLLLLNPYIILAQQSSGLYTIASFDTTTNFYLEPACAAIYRRSIPTCQSTDFSPANPCSTQCIDSLTSIQTEAKSACASSGAIPTDSLLTAFRMGMGVTQLCTNRKAAGVATAVTSVSGSQATATTPAGAGGVSTATSVPENKNSGMVLSKSGVVAVIVTVSLVSVVLVLVGLFFWNMHYNRKGPMEGGV